MDKDENPKIYELTLAQFNQEIVNLKIFPKKKGPHKVKTTTTKKPDGVN